MSTGQRLDRSHARAYARPWRAADADPFSHDSTATALARLSALVEMQARVIRDQRAAIHAREIFEAAAAAARLGTWECDLADESLHWSAGTYAIFDLPTGAPLVRSQALACYPEHSMRLLERTRGRALRERRGFRLDTDIVTPKGAHRWIRITATVECAGERPARLFGIKQDITEERARSERTRYLAEFDEMTGLANRSQFHARLEAACAEDGGGALLLIDLDGFKEVNDTLGHTAGDKCLQEAARRLREACGGAELVARVGGDEFAVLYAKPLYSVEAGALAARIVEAIKRPIRSGHRRFTIGASVGIAGLKGASAAQTFERADMALYAAKAGGRNTYRSFRG